MLNMITLDKAAANFSSRKVALSLLRLLDFGRREAEKEETQATVDPS
jgi:hypothetical protein